MANDLDVKAEMQRGVDLLRTLRDEIKVKLHLAGMDAKDQWAKLEPELFKVERAAEQATESSKKLVDDALSGDQFRCPATAIAFGGIDRVHQLQHNVAVHRLVDGPQRRLHRRSRAVETDHHRR